MHTPTIDQTNTIYLLLQNSQLDLRDNRGKRHQLCYVFVSLILALFRNRDGNLSSIHRSMVNKNIELSQSLGLETMPVISRSHLPVFLQKIDLAVFTEILFLFLGIKLDANKQAWFALDGKEMGGSIVKGDKRGEALVLAVSHKDRAVVGQKFYSGKKESEKTCLQALLSQTGIEDQKLTMDALHLSPKTLTQIQKSKGIYVIGLKENQKELLMDMETSSQTLPTSSCYRQTEKGHGRVEERNYQTYSIKNRYFDERWEGVNFQTLVKVNRVFYNCKNKVASNQTAFYISNQAVENAADFQLAYAIRAHWQVEANNYIRDVILREDWQRTIKTEVTQILATCRTLVINLLYQLKPINMVAQLELFSDDFNHLIKWCKEIKFL